MNVEKILAIAGKPGLFELKLQTRSGFLAESLLDGKKITVGLSSNVSLLSEISMYTYTEEKPLVEIMRAIAVKENEGPTSVFGRKDEDDDHHEHGRRRGADRRLLVRPLDDVGPARHELRTLKEPQKH